MNKVFTLFCSLMLAVSASAFKFEIFDITTSSAVVITIADNAKQGYINSFLDLETYSTMTETEIAEEFKKYMDQYGSNYEGMASFGNDSALIKGLDENTEYVVFAYPLNMTTGMPSAKFDTAHFTTSSYSESNNKLSISYNAESNDLTITASNKDPYFLFIDPLDYYNSKQKDFSETSLTDQLDSWSRTMTSLERIADLTLTGTQTVTLDWCFSHMYFSMKPVEGMDYVAMVIPYNGAVNGKPAYLVFTCGENKIIEGLKDVNVDAKANKVLRDGMLLLERNGQNYTTGGQRL